METISGSSKGKLPLELTASKRDRVFQMNLNGWGIMTLCCGIEKLCQFAQGIYQELAFSTPQPTYRTANIKQPEVKVQTYYCCRVNNFGFGDFTGTICSKLKNKKNPATEKPQTVKINRQSVRTKKRLTLSCFPQLQLHNTENLMEEKSEKGLIRAAKVERIVSVAPTTGCNQLYSFLCVVLDTFSQKNQFIRIRTRKENK